MDADYDEDTPCKLVADNSAITVGEVEEERDGTTTVYTKFRSPFRRRTPLNCAIG